MNKNYKAYLVQYKEDITSTKLHVKYITVLATSQDEVDSILYKLLSFKYELHKNYDYEITNICIVNLNELHKYLIHYDFYEYDEYKYSQTAVILADNKTHAKQYLSGLKGYDKYKVSITNIEEITTIPYISDYEQDTR